MYSDSNKNKMKDRHFSLRKRVASFGFAFRGIRLLITEEHNAWIHCFAAISVVIAGVFLNLSALEWMIIAIVIGVVLAMEAINTAIEILCDLVKPEYNEKIRHIKDLAAGAVLFSGISAAITGLIIFIPKICALF